MTPVNPYAYFDCLTLATRIEAVLGNVTKSEIHLFGYLSCALTLFRHNPVSDWGYPFAGTVHSTPFSYDIADSIETLMETGMFIESNQALIVSALGKDEYRELCGLSENAIREEFHDGACASLLVMPIGMIRNAMGEEPSISRSMRNESTRRLLEGAGLDVLYNQCAVLTDVIGTGAKDLMVPATGWLAVLSQSSKTPWPLGSE